MFSRRCLVGVGLLAAVLGTVGCRGGGGEEDDASVGPDLSMDSGDSAPLETDGGDASDNDAGGQDAQVFFEGWSLDDAESTDEACQNDLDDDGSGYKDCKDFWCTDTVTVQVCQALENTDELCSDGVDNPEKPTGKTYYDGLVDCDDPDCLKNPRITVCAHLNPLKWESPASCAAGEDSDGDDLAGCDDPDCWTAENNCPLNGRVRVLFDDAHHQRAGSVDWIVDSSGRLPWPSVPAKETDWSGALSSFGKALFDTGRFTVERLPPSSKLAFGGDSAQDLKNYGVLVIPEPSSQFGEDESKAVAAFVQAGGGLLMVTDHAESDRDGNNWDSVQALNDMLTAASGGQGLDGNPFGFKVAWIDYNESGQLDKLNKNIASTIPQEVSAHPVLNGVHGIVTQTGMFKGGLFTILDDAKAVTLIHAVPMGTAGYETGSPFVVAAEPGQGRVVAVGDSALMNDGTDSHGRTMLNSDAWHSETQQNAALFLNAVEWLARKDGSE